MKREEAEKVEESKTIELLEGMWKHHCVCF